MNYLNKFLVLIMLLATSCTSNKDVASYVNPFIGTGAHGHTFPGATRPNAMLQVSPDTHLLGWDASSGYQYDDKKIYGFSHTHLSGTGNGDMGDISLMPYSGKEGLSPVAIPDKNMEYCCPGYYSVYLKNFDIKVELTATDHVGFHKYTYKKQDQRCLMFDLGHVLQPDWGHKLVGSTYKVINDHCIEGVFKTKGWADKHNVYYRIEFSEPYKSVKTYLDSLVVNNSEDIKTDKDLKLHYFFADSDKPLMVKVAISPVDVDGAAKNMEEELPGWDFNKIKKESYDVWNEALMVVDVESEDSVVMENFYTALYHSMMAPNAYEDVDGRYLGMDKKIHQAEGDYVSYTVFSLWDTFRALHPLLTIVNPSLAKMCGESLVKAYQEGGIVPRWALACNYTGIMVGYPGMSVLADLVCKNLYDKKDLDLWCEAAEQSSIYRPDLYKRYGDSRECWVVASQTYYKDKYGIIPADSASASVAWGLECAYYDWCVAQIAKKNNKVTVYNEYMKKSLAYNHYYDPETQFMRRINIDGNFVDKFNPKSQNGYQEGDAYQWSPFVLHNIDSLVNLVGGKDKFEKWLDRIFDTSLSGGHSADVSGLIGEYAHGNEPSHHIAYLYNWTNSPWKAQKVLDEIMRRFYTNNPNGIIGNEDCGQMSAWYVLSAMGFYQVCPGKPVYSIGRPMLDKAKIRVGQNKYFEIIVHNNSAKNMFVKKVELNGKVLSTLSFTHADIINGKKLEIFMSNKHN